MNIKDILKTLKSIFALDKNVVHKSGSETISGNKLFIDNVQLTSNNFDPHKASDTEGWFSNALRFYGSEGNLLSTLQGWKLPNNRNRMKLFVRTKDGIDGTFSFDDDGSFYAKSIFGGDNSIDCSVDSQGDRWIRYSNGIQICWGSDSHRKLTFTITYPKAFVKTSAIPIVCYGDMYNTEIGLCVHDFNKTSFTVRRNGQEDVWRINWQAIGRWK